MKWCVILVGLWATGIRSGAAESPERLVERERAFARWVAEKGVSPGFAAFLADDGYIFQPQPVPGRSWHRTNAAPGRLLWVPELAVMSHSGDLGYTTGPWQYFADTTSDAPVAGGHYFSVWRKDTNQVWNVVADIGVRHSLPSLEEVKPVLRQLDGPAGPAPGIQVEGAGRAKTEKSAEAATPPPSALTSRVRVYRMGIPPAIGVEAAQVAWEEQGRMLLGKQLKEWVSSCGSLRCEVGTGQMQLAELQPGTVDLSYLRVWEREPKRDWRLAVEVVLPWPAAKTTDEDSKP